MQKKTKNNKKLDPLIFKNKWVLVTGASSGLGREFARKLAVDYGANLVLVARRLNLLENLKSELMQVSDVQIKTFASDLSDLNTLSAFLEKVTASIGIHAVILNAGVTYFGEHSALSSELITKMIDLNVKSAVISVEFFASYFKSKVSGGGILLVSSLAGSFPVPFQSVYSGSKAFLTAYGLALAEELSGAPFSISVFAPGGIQTEMTATENFANLSKWLMPVQIAAKEGLTAFQKRKPFYISGSLNRVLFFFSRFVPRSVIISKLGNTYRRALKRD